MTLDFKDKQILYALDLDSRQSNKRIAKKCRISEQTVGYRIRKLQEGGVIRNFHIKTNNMLLGYTQFKTFVRLQNMPSELETEFVSSLSSNRRVLWLVSTRGNYDYVISILAKNAQDFASIYREATKKFEKHILRREVIVLESGSIFSSRYLIDREPIEFSYSLAPAASELDGFDEKILEALSVNARKSSVELANDCGASPDKIIRRIKQMTKDGVITGFGATLDFRKLGMRYYLVSLKLQGMDEKGYATLKALAVVHKCAFYFLRTIGSHDLELELLVRDEEQLNGFIRSVKDRFFNELREYDLLEVVEEHKLNYYPF
jgi:Lrp/AsnC family leucine-responsive transcriptional regulator